MKERRDLSKVVSADCKTQYITGTEHLQGCTHFETLSLCFYDGMYLRSCRSFPLLLEQIFSNLCLNHCVWLNSSRDSPSCSHCRIRPRSMVRAKEPSPYFLRMESTRTSPSCLEGITRAVATTRPDMASVAIRA